MDGGYGGLEHWIHVSTGTHPVAKDITKVLVVKFFSHIFVMRDTVMSFTLSGKRWPQFQGRGILGDIEGIRKTLIYPWDGLAIWGTKKNEKKMRPLGLWCWDSSGSG